MEMHPQKYERQQVRESRMSRELLLSVLSGTLGASFQFGFSTGFVNNMATYVQDYFEEIGVEPLPRTDESNAHFKFMWSIAVSGFAMGGMLGTFIFPTLGNSIGRKRAIMSTTIFCYGSCYCLAFPSSWGMLIAGRILVGIGAGGACAAVPTYISEISPKELRGTMGTVHQLMITIGIVIAQGLSTSKLHLLGDDDLWHYTLVVPFFCTTFLLCTMPFCVDSPAYLFRLPQGHTAARDALAWLRPKTERSQARIYRELRHLKDELDLGDQNATISDVLKDELLWKPLLVGSVVNLSMQFSGIDAVFYYSTSVFENAGIPLEWAQVATTVVGLCNVLVTIPAMLFMDKAGRKAIQITGLLGMGGAYIIMTFALVNDLHVLAVAAMVLIICFFAFGPGCIAWFIIAELMPVHARGIATTVALGVNWAANWFIAFIFPQIQAQLGRWTFGVFAISTVLLATYTWFFLPETKGRTILEIREAFSSGDLMRVNSAPTLGQPLLPKDATNNLVRYAGMGDESPFGGASPVFSPVSGLRRNREGALSSHGGSPCGGHSPTRGKGIPLGENSPQRGTQHVGLHRSMSDVDALAGRRDFSENDGVVHLGNNVTILNMHAKDKDTVVIQQPFDEDIE